MTTKRRLTIGHDPLDSVIPMAPLHPPMRSTASPTATAERISKERLTIHLPLELIDRVKNAVYWTPGLTLASLAEEAFEHTLKRLEHQRGEAYPPRKSELKGGRPLK